jgi:hypothetical protein
VKGFLRRVSLPRSFSPRRPWSSDAPLEAHRPAESLWIEEARPLPRARFQSCAAASDLFSSRRAGERRLPEAAMPARAANASFSKA